MITTDLMTPAADAAGARYQGLVDAWSLIYADALGALDFGTPRMIERAGEEAYNLARAFLDTETGIVAEKIATIAHEALRAASRDLGVDDADDLPAHASETLSATQGYLVREITIQIERDIAQLQQSLRQTALQVKIAAAAQGISERAALIQHRIGSNETPAFHFRDRRNGKWPSRLFVRSTWRQSLLSAFNEVTLCMLAEHGIETAEVAHAHGKAGVHGMELALSSNSSLPAYGEVRNDIFHPNAEAILVVPGIHRSVP
ncbi:hypothetical protein [Methylobacterium sp. AMS5]|uniref:hypothetical protein n=1 Tax=Methylobacterium sp. AMS5 TaxID=925818 RepID=UPI00074F9770|nr:hypothetical protein [Methylobacterium sp. AMS5]AMB48266.1 hypothetical protein Y590_25195 [Methylobacterium sp. AMS5]